MIQSQVLITDQSVAVVESLETLLPSLRRLSSAKLSNQQADDLVAILDELILYAKLMYYDNMFKPNVLNKYINKIVTLKIYYDISNTPCQSTVYKT